MTRRKDGGESPAFYFPSAFNPITHAHFMQSSLFTRRSLFRLLAFLALAAAMLLSSFPADLHAQGTNMTGATLTLSDWSSIGGSNTVSNSSLAVGDASSADGYALSLGQGNSALDQAFALGDSNTAEYLSLAAGSGSHATDASATFGYYNSADGSSIATGYQTSAMAYSLATGEETSANGDSFASGFGSSATYMSAATGYFTVAAGLASSSAGYSTTAQSFASFVVGQFNRTSSAYNPYSWVGADPLFVVGNGTASNAQNDAFIIYKNGKIRMQVAQGDISMGSFAQ